MVCVDQVEEKEGDLVHGVVGGNGAEMGTFRKLVDDDRIVVKPWEDGNLVIKSRDMSSQIEEGIGKGCKRLAGFFVSYLVYWQTIH